VGLAVLLVFWAVAFWFADRTVKAVLAMLFAMFFSFDLFTWMNAGVLASLMIALPRSDERSQGLARPAETAVALRAT